jgi:hypothetical protein
MAETSGLDRDDGNMSRPFGGPPPRRMIGDPGIDLRRVLQFRPGHKERGIRQDRLVPDERLQSQLAELPLRRSKFLWHLKQVVWINLLRCGRLAKGRSPSIEKREQ